MKPTPTICAPATAAGVSAIAIVRLSGLEAIAIAAKVFSKKSICKAKGHSVHFGEIFHNGNVIDEVLLTIFRAPHSYTGEEAVEISCHGSPFIVQKILEALIENGAEMAGPGEFTQRAFLNGKLDLSQAEAVADLIASENEAGHKVALSQLKGGYSNELSQLREQLIHFASLIELELDFGEEDVEFASRRDFRTLAEKIIDVCGQLAESFSLGNALKNGVPTVIAGKPNAGKSTLLNALLNEERAIVSNIAGTTRDTIEETLHIDGIAFKLIDTAGIRSHAEHIEALGIERTLQKIDQAAVVIYVADMQVETVQEIQAVLCEIYTQGKHWIVALNKTDAMDMTSMQMALKEMENFSEMQLIFLPISSLHKQGIDLLKNELRKTIPQIGGYNGQVVSNVRHYQALVSAKESLQEVLQGMELHLTGDMLAVDIRKALHSLGEITGSISTYDLLTNIFSRFCIGK